VKQILKRQLIRLNHFHKHYYDKLPKLVILLYHKVLPTMEQNPDGTIISLKTFDKQIKYLAKKYSIISLTDAISQCDLGKAKSKIQVVITFDDGTKNNYQYVFPLLKSMGIQATFFLPVDYIGSQEIIWDWKLVKTINSIKKNFELVNDESNINLKRQNYRNQRIFIREVISQLKRVPPNKRKILIDSIYNKIGEHPYLFNFDKCMNWNEIRDMQYNGMDIGSHGCSHSSLGQIPFNDAINEIVLSKKIIEKEIGVPCFHFSFPYGANEDINYQLIKCVKKSGYKGCLLNIHGYNHIEQSTLAFKRVIVYEHTNLKYLLSSYV